MTWHKDINCGLMSIISLIFQKMQYKWVFKKKNVFKRRPTKFGINWTSYKKMILVFLSTLRSLFITTTVTNWVSILPINTILQNGITFLSFGIFTWNKLQNTNKSMENFIWYTDQNYEMKLWYHIFFKENTSKTQNLL